MAFLDDDAEAAPDWLERLLALYDDPDVLAVGGRVEPVWETGRPGYFGEELDWIVGCSHRGMPKVASEVRNVIGANMSFRLEVLRQVGGFNVSLGRQGTKPLGCEETEICIRSKMGSPRSRIVYEPAAWFVTTSLPTGEPSPTCCRVPGPKGSPKPRSARSLATRGHSARNGATSGAYCRGPFFPGFVIGAGATTRRGWAARVR